MPGKPPLDPATKEINEKTEEGMKPMMKTPEDTDCGENKTSEIVRRLTMTHVNNNQLAFKLKINQDRTITEKSSSAAMSTFSFGSTTGTSFPAFGFFNAASSSTPLNSNTVAAASTSDKADQEGSEKRSRLVDILTGLFLTPLQTGKSHIFHQNKISLKLRNPVVSILQG